MLCYAVLDVGYAMLSCAGRDMLWSLLQGMGVVSGVLVMSLVFPPFLPCRCLLFDLRLFSNVL